METPIWAYVGRTPSPAAGLTRIPGDPVHRRVESLHSAVAGAGPGDLSHVRTRLVPVRTGLPRVVIEVGVLFLPGLVILRQPGSHDAPPNLAARPR